MNNANGAPVAGAPGLNCETSDSDHVRDAAPARKPGRKTDRRSPRRGPTLAEPVRVAQFWKNRKGDAIVVGLSTFENLNLVDVRQHFTAKDGTLMPSKNGIALNVLRLPELSNAIDKALVKARELGLLDPEEPAP